MSGILDVCDELAVLLEPDDALRDDSRAEPAEYDVDTLYLWPRVVRFDADESGPVDMVNFDIRLAWVEDRWGEGDPDRSVTEAIVERAEAMAALIRSHRTGRHYLSAFISFDFTALRGQDARGFEAVIVGRTLAGSRP